MTDTASYEDSSLDRAALSQLAHRAAQQTPLKPDPRIVYYDREAQNSVEVLGPHWVLAHRWERSEDQPNDAVIEEGSANAIYALLPSGELVLVKLFEELRISTTGAWKKETNRHDRQPMSDFDIESFDRERKYYDRSYPPANRLWGDLHRSEDRGELLHDTKGAGLLALLEAIRTGEADLPRPSQFHTVQTPPPTPPVQPSQASIAAGNGGFDVWARLPPVVKGAIISGVLGLILAFAIGGKLAPLIVVAAVTMGVMIGWFFTY